MAARLSFRQRSLISAGTVAGALVGVSLGMSLILLVGGPLLGLVAGEGANRAPGFLLVAGFGLVSGVVLAAGVKIGLTRHLSRAVGLSADQLGTGLWEDHYRACRAQVRRFELAASGLDGAERAWLLDLHADLVEQLARVRQLAELGQRLHPSSLESRHALFRLRDPALVIHARLRDAERRFRQLADEAGHAAAAALTGPDVSDVRAGLGALRAARAETGAALASDQRPRGPEHDGNRHGPDPEVGPMPRGSAGGPDDRGA